MDVTIITDASFCPELNVAGYGVWVASARGKKGYHGILDGDIENNNIAELKVIVNGIYIGFRMGLIRCGDRVLLQSDSLASLAALQGKRANTHKQEDKVVEWFNSFIAMNCLQAEFNHVRGHSNNRKARYASQGICDKQARQNLKKARNLKRIRILKAELELM